MSYYSEKELKSLGFKSLGKDVFLSKKCSVYGAGNISIGNNVRIDDFCILSGNIKIGNYVHISAFAALYGKFGIEIGSFCGLSPRTTIYSATDDFSGEYMISPMVPPKFCNVTGGTVILNNYVQLGANTIVMPSVVCHEGSASGVFSFISKDLEEWCIYVGIPAKKLKIRSRNIIYLHNQLLQECRTN